ncbi:hypothetical protein [Ornithinimicrobium flavum]|uniref:hypothetical protein n=1 Tax=Ornithinimicrobium flavum TaxID=1288636 RepID=UPI0010704130|nr:hypothetical protein [Ornithinimicrobium flavum]
MTVRIDPDGVLAMSAATLVASGTATGVGEDLQAALDRVDHLVPGAPSARRRVAGAAADLAAAAGAAREHALRYVDDVRPLRELLTAGYWLPDPGNLGWSGDRTLGENVDRILRSDEFGAGVLGTGEALLERYRNWQVHMPRTGPAATRALGEISALVELADRVEVRGGEVVGGQRWVTRNGLLVPASWAESVDRRAVVDAVTPRILQLSDDAVHPVGRQLVPDPTVGRPPAWARHTGRGLVVVGTALSLYDAGASQWEHDQRYHPEYSTGQRVASTGWNVATEGGGAVAGGIAGAKVGAAFGATIGSVVPGLGTGVGAVVGGVLGGAIGGFVGSKAGKAVGRGLREGAERVWSSLFG